MERRPPRRRAAANAVGLLIFALAGGACAARQAPTQPAQSAQAEPDSKKATPAVPATALQTIEEADARLKAALAAQKSAQTPDTLKNVAAEYARLGVFDRAIAYLTRAIDLEPRNATLLAARARAWRDWGQPGAALGDAHRAVFLAPRSADALNTLGTIQFALDLPEDASATFERALALAPNASWGLNNLCYVALIGGDEATALSRCRAALEQDPESSTTRNNLALVHAASGRLEEARAMFLSSGNRPVANYNMGVVLMAAREYRAASEAFGEACRLRPAFDAACRRAIEARKLAAGGASR